MECIKDKEFSYSIKICKNKNGVNLVNICKKCYTLNNIKNKRCKKCLKKIN